MLLPPLRYFDESCLVNTFVFLLGSARSSVDFNLSSSILLEEFKSFFAVDFPSWFICWLNPTADFLTTLGCEVFS